LSNLKLSIFDQDLTTFQQVVKSEVINFWPRFDNFQQVVKSEVINWLSLKN